MSGYEDIPRAYISGPKGLSEIPEEGTITFKFRRKEVSVRDGDRPVSLTLELLAVVGSSAHEEKKDPSAGEAIDKLFREMDEEED